MTEFGHWTDMARRAVCRLLHRQPAVRVGPGVTVDWRESTRRVLEEQAQAMADGLKAHERLMMAANAPDIHEVVEEVVNRKGWTIGGMPLSGPVEPLIFNDNDNPWESIVTDARMTTGDVVEPSSLLESVAHTFHVMLPEGANVLSIEYATPDGVWHKWGDWNERLLKAFALWRRVFDNGLDPYHEDKYGLVYCLFCGSQDHEPHESDCIYVQAKALFPVEKEAGDK